MAKKKFKKSKSNFLDAYKSVRKPMPPATKVITPKKYDRKDKSWLDEKED